MLDKVMGIAAGEKRRADEMRIITIYRYVSLLSISFFFFAGSENLTIFMKTFIVASITMSALILNYLYQRNHDISGNIKLLVIIETLGNSLFLIPTGGLSSPFVWYSINTILVSAVMLEGLYCWISLSTYLFTSTYIAYLIFGNADSSFIVFAGNESNLILSLILITAIIRQLALYIRMLRVEGIKQAEMNRQLSYANHKVRESMNHIMELYQTVYMFTTLNDKEDIISTITEYTGKVIKSNLVFFYSFADGQQNKLKIDMKKPAENVVVPISSKITEIKAVVMSSSNPLETVIDNRRYLLTPIRSNCIAYGVLGIDVEEDNMNDNIMEYMDHMKFMSDLGNLAFERLEMDQVNERLVVAEEQNRIANEIHDNVQQRLFSTSFGIYGIIKNIQNLTDNEVINDLNLVRNSIDNAMTELRSAIYSMSWSKGSTDNFMVDTMKFIDEIKKLNNVNIDFRLIGGTDMLSLTQKKSLYRIICESIGNSVRHGVAGYIEVSLSVQSNIVILKIIDNGVGFDFKLLKQKQQGGLGIRNIELLVQYLKGKVFISSCPGKGTKIKVTFPLITQFGREENII